MSTCLRDGALRRARRLRARRRWRGSACAGVFKMDIKRDPRDGGFRVLEVNARFNMWHHVAREERHQPARGRLQLPRARRARPACRRCRIAPRTAGCACASTPRRTASSRGAASSRFAAWVRLPRCAAPRCTSCSPGPTRDRWLRAARQPRRRRARAAPRLRAGACSSDGTLRRPRRHPRATARRSRRRSRASMRAASARLLCLGDIVGYNADPVECVRAAARARRLARSPATTT